MKSEISWCGSYLIQLVLEITNTILKINHLMIRRIVWFINTMSRKKTLFMVQIFGTSWHGYQLSRMNLLVSRVQNKPLVGSDSGHTFTFHNNREYFEGFEASRFSHPVSITSVLHSICSPWWYRFISYIGVWKIPSFQWGMKLIWNQTVSPFETTEPTACTAKLDWNIQTDIESCNWTIWIWNRFSHFRHFWRSEPSVFSFGDFVCRTFKTPSLCHRGQPWIEPWDWQLRRSQISAVFFWFPSYWSTSYLDKDTNHLSIQQEIGKTCHKTCHHALVCRKTKSGFWTHLLPSFAKVSDHSSSGGSSKSKGCAPSKCSVPWSRLWPASRWNQQEIGSYPAW